MARDNVGGMCWSLWRRDINLADVGAAVKRILVRTVAAVLFLAVAYWVLAGLDWQPIRKEIARWVE